MSFAVQPAAPARPNRCQLFGPGSRPALFPKMAASAADVINLDLEDAVAPADKDVARENIVEALNTVDFGTKTVSARINGLDTQWWVDDVTALQSLLRPLPHYGGQSYVLFDGGRAVERGIWPLTRGALYRDLTGG